MSLLLKGFPSKSIQTMQPKTQQSYKTKLLIMFLCSQKFYRYHEMLHEKETERAQLVSGGPTTRPPYWKIFKQASPQLFNIFFVFFVTLSIFPAVHSDIAPSDPNFVVDSKMYVSVLCFLTFNVSAMLGSMTTSFVQFVSGF